MDGENDVACVDGDASHGIAEGQLVLSLSDSMSPSGAWLEKVVEGLDGRGVESWARARV